MGIDHAVEYADALAAFLPGERVLAATVTSTAGGVGPGQPPATGDQPRATGRPPRAPRRGGRPSGDHEYTWWSVALGVLTAPANLMPSPDWLERLVRGRAASGYATSIAAQVYHATDSELHVLLAVTEGSVHLFELLDTPAWVYSSPEGRKPPRQRIAPMIRLDRKEIRTATAGWCRLSPGRLVVHFMDDSWVAFSQLMLMGRVRAKKIADLLQAAPGRPEPGRPG